MNFHQCETSPNCGRSFAGMSFHQIVGEVSIDSGCEFFQWIRSVDEFSPDFILLDPTDGWIHLRFCKFALLSFR